MEIKLTKLVVMGTVREGYSQYDLTPEEESRNDIDPKKLYLVRYSGTWLIGRFQKLPSPFRGATHRWIFNPNLGVMSPQIDSLDQEIYEVEGLPQKVDGSTASHILSYLRDEDTYDD